MSLLKQLQGDFRAVEEKFKEITQQVQQRQNAGRDTRGGILEFALDAEDVLKEEDQGVSFHEFVRFILSPSQQDKFQAIIQQLMRIEELAEQVDGLETIRRMIPMLLAEAEQVMRTNQRLSATPETPARCESVPRSSACGRAAAGDQGLGGFACTQSAGRHRRT